MHHFLGLLAISLISSLGVHASPSPLPRDKTSIIPTLARRDASSVPIPPNCSTSFFTQPIDHSAPGNGSFGQQFQVQTDYFKPGGPIFLFHGEETSTMTCVETTIMSSWAQQTGGIAASLEHRYFGLSAPFGPNASYTRENIKYLTLDNVMDDAVSFVQAIKKNITGAENSKVIIASGSYGGYLVTMLRLNHPETFYGSISAASPVRSFSNSTDNPAKFNWWNWVSNVYSDQSAEAAAKIKASWTAFAERFESGNVTSLKSELGLCTAPTNSTTDRTTLASAIGYVFSLAAELNYPVAQPGRSPIGRPLEAVINATLKQTDPIQVLNASNWLWYGPLGVGCLDWNNSQLALEGVPLIQTTPFNYITCTYVPLSSIDISNDTIFYPTPDLGGSAPLGCELTWGVETPSEAALQARYHYTQADIEKSERIIFSRGQYDPTSSVGPEPLPESANRNKSRILYVSGMAHREDLFAPASWDGEGVTQARAIELETIKEWLGL